MSRFSQGMADGLPDTHNNRFRDAEERTAARSLGGGDRWSPPPGLPDIYIAMGQTAENVRELENVTRREMDEFAALSQQRAVASQENGFFEREISALTLSDGTEVRIDDGPRPGTTVEKLAELKPAFRPDGEITAGNSCPLNDGAAAVIVMSDTQGQRARDHSSGPGGGLRCHRPRPRDHGPGAGGGLPPWRSGGPA